MPTPSITHAEKWMRESRLGSLTAERRVQTRLDADVTPAMSTTGLVVGRHSAGVWLDSSDYEGRHRSRDFVIPAMVDGVLVRFNPGRAA